VIYIYMYTFKVRIVYAASRNYNITKYNIYMQITTAVNNRISVRYYYYDGEETRRVGDVESIREKSEIIYYNDLYFIVTILIYYYIFILLPAGGRLCSVESQPLSSVYNMCIGIHDDAQVCNPAHGQPRKLVFGKFCRPREDKTHSRYLLELCERNTFDFI